MAWRARAAARARARRRRLRRRHLADLRGEDTARPDGGDASAPHVARVRARARVTHATGSKS